MNEIFVGVLGALFFALLAWGFKKLPGERWQIIAAVPMLKGEDGHWRGLNFTYYGLFTAIAYVVATAILLVLAGSAGVAPIQAFAVVVIGSILCMPAARIVAMIVERKRHTFTVAGASFVGVITAPAIIWLVSDQTHEWVGSGIPVLPMMAAMATAYAFGEGLGRLACISFGCCYGRTVSTLSPPMQKVFNNWNFEFLGNTKKISYASGLEGVKVVPIQAITAILYVVTGIASTWLYLNSFYFASLTIAIVVTQLWRLVSEFLRADYRGGNRITAYQWMAVVSTIYATGFGAIASGAEMPVANLLSGIAVVWAPLMLVFLQILFFAIFAYTGRSEVTETNMSIHVCQDRI